ncbi:MAG TPA: 5-(carboxyamino)imidazole ribonucleotide mutase [Candidatus Omnitrophota bacterium]|nr:5-(carboxyamino)imidazole ribonucleotide mutase [Candidatus Omnitrophota bacterium]
MKDPQVVIVMGSDSDWPTVSEAAKLLKEFNIAFEAKVLSAHRTPEETAQYASKLESRGVKVAIAAAGGAAALAGVIAAHTSVPVIGIPMHTSDLNGMDSLLSTVQMPPGVPVGTVAIGKMGAKNAAFLAMRILALNDKGLRSQLSSYRKSQKQKIIKIKLEL